LQILFTITFWLLLRQHLTEQKALQLKEATLSEVKVGNEEDEEKGKALSILLESSSHNRSSGYCVSECRNQLERL